MRKSSLFLYAMLMLLLASCGKNQQEGQLVGASPRPKWDGINPFGMVYVPSGTLTVGQSDQDFFHTLVQPQNPFPFQDFTWTILKSLIMSIASLYFM